MTNKSIDELIDIYIELVLGSSDSSDSSDEWQVCLTDNKDELKRKVQIFTKYMFDRKNLLDEIKKKIYTDQSQGVEYRKSILISEIRDIKLKKII